MAEHPRDVLDERLAHALAAALVAAVRRGELDAPPPVERDAVVSCGKNWRKNGASRPARERGDRLLFDTLKGGREHHESNTG